MILPSELLSGENVYRQIPGQCQLRPAGPPQRVKDPAMSPATKPETENPHSSPTENPKGTNSSLKQLEKPGSEPPAPPARKVAELLTIITPASLPAEKIPIIVPDQERLDENHYPLLIGTGRDKRQIVAATRRPKRRSKNLKNCSTPRITFGTKTVVRRPTKRLSPLQTEP